MAKNGQGWSIMVKIFGPQWPKVAFLAFSSGVFFFDLFLPKVVKKRQKCPKTAHPHLWPLFFFFADLRPTPWSETNIDCFSDHPRLETNISSNWTRGLLLPLPPLFCFILWPLDDLWTVDSWQQWFAFLHQVFHSTPFPLPSLLHRDQALKHCQLLTLLWAQCCGAIWGRLFQVPLGCFLMPGRYCVTRKRCWNPGMCFINCVIFLNMPVFRELLFKSRDYRCNKDVLQQPL